MSLSVRTRSTECTLAFHVHLQGWPWDSHSPFQGFVFIWEIAFKLLRLNCADYGLRSCSCRLRFPLFQLVYDWWCLVYSVFCVITAKYCDGGKGLLKLTFHSIIFRSEQDLSHIWIYFEDTLYFRSNVLIYLGLDWFGCLSVLRTTAVCVCVALYLSLSTQPKKHTLNRRWCW